MIEQDKCYMCSAPATSREHVPPQCLFPEKKDIGNHDLRVNLITVPSCELHNSAKSKDDEFLMLCLAGVVGNNAIGYIHTHTKVNRAFRRKNPSFFDTIMRNRKERIITLKNGQKFRVYQGEPDFYRLQKCFDHIARGLYWHEFNKPFHGDCNICISFIQYFDNNLNKLDIIIEKAFENDTKGLSAKGTNPEVFTYLFSPLDRHGLFTLKLTFYEGTEIYVGFTPKGIQVPENIANALINKGIKTIVGIGGGKTVEFN